MALERQKDREVVEEAWRQYMTTGKFPENIPVPWYKSTRFRSVFRHLPTDPRCRLCYYPFEGIGGAMVRGAFGIKRSRMNPTMCNLCEQFAQEYEGGAEVEITILFTDVRGSTSLAEKMSSTEFSQLISRFYNTVTKVLYDSGAMVEKLIGDAVTGFYTTGFTGSEHPRVAIEAARAILKRTNPWIPVGIGVHTGPAYVGTVSTNSGGNDITVLGDTPNTGARLAAAAGAGEILVSQATAGKAGLSPGEVEIRQLNLKGRSESIQVWVL